MPYSRPYFVNYLLSIPGLEIVEHHDIRDRTITFEFQRRRAFLWLGIHDTIVDDISAQRICTRLGVGLPPNEERC